MSFNKTGICWCDYTWNPLTGCKHGCLYCYAHAFALRGMGRYKETGFEPTVHLDRFNVEPPVEPSRIFVCSMGDALGDWKWEPLGGTFLYDVLEDNSKKYHEAFIPVIAQICLWRYIEAHPAHQFILLTKNPGGLKRLPIKTYHPTAAICERITYHYSDLPPNLIWGVSITGKDPASLERLRVFNEVRRPEERVVISYEPALTPLPELPEVEPGMGWLIVGAQTGPGAEPVNLGFVESAIYQMDGKGTRRDPNWSVWVKENVGALGPREQLPMPVVQGEEGNE